MSRAYRIKVQESVRRVIRAEDHVATTLELLDILPREETTGLLRAELLGRGFRDEGGLVVRRDGEITVTVDPASGEVVARAESETEVKLKAARQGWADVERGARDRKAAESALRDQLKTDLEGQADRKAAEAQRQATDRLEAALGGLRGELDQVVNRVTAEALKRKAARLGRITEMTEDPEAGSLTIVLEV